MPETFPMATSSSIPDLPDSHLIHERSYIVRAYRESETMLRLRGMVYDEKPPGLYFPEDPKPLPVHQMVVDLFLDFPSLEISKVDVVMEVTPHTTCNKITDDYQKLVGLSIARGFSRKVKDLFGGPSGCTHIGALLQAMAPVAVQSIWSMRALSDGPAITGQPGTSEEAIEARKRGLSFNLNSCHIWDEEGPMVVGIMKGGEIEIPVWAEERLAELGRSPEDWRRV